MLDRKSVDTYGDVDELQAWLGLARATGAPERLGVMLEQIQRDLFALGALERLGPHD